MRMHAPVQWRIENFSTLSSEAVWSDCFEAGISTWWVVAMWMRGCSVLSCTAG
jgi:hypothetical protein